MPKIYVPVDESVDERARELMQKYLMLLPQYWSREDEIRLFPEFALLVIADLQVKVERLEDRLRELESR